MMLLYANMADLTFDDLTQYDTGFVQRRHFVSHESKQTTTHHTTTPKNCELTMSIEFSVVPKVPILSVHSYYHIVGTTWHEYSMLLFWFPKYQ